MISYDEFNEFCKSLPQTTYVVQWGGAHVWKVGDKVFAIGGWNKGKTSGVTFKCSEISYEMLREQPGLRPAPYLASRGMKWIQMYDDPGLSKDELFSYIEESYRQVIKKLTKKKRKELSLEE